MSRKCALALICSLLFLPLPLYPGCQAEEGPTVLSACTGSLGGPAGHILQPARAGQSDEFDGPDLDPRWSWYNPPQAFDVGVTTAGQLHLVANRNTNFGGSSDSGVLLYQNASGNFSIETKMASDPGANFEKAGIMVRNNASNWVSLFYQAQNGKQVELTTKVGGVASDNLKAVTASPVWLRLERDGQTFTAYYSTDGSGWTFGWSVSVALSDSVSIGLVIADGNANADYSADFDYFRFGAPNHAPSVKEAYSQISFEEDGRAAIKASDHFVDIDGDALTYTVTDAAHISGAFNTTLGDYELWGAPNWFGAEFATIKAADRFGAWTMSQVRVIVSAAEDPPCLLKDIGDIIVPQGGFNSSVNLSKYFFDNDTLFGGNDALGFAFLGGSPLHISIAPSGQATVSAPIDFWGETNMTFTATDKAGHMAAGPARAMVYHVNQAPQVKASPPDTTVNEDESVTMPLAPVFWDPDGDPLTLSATGNSQLSVSFNGLEATFTPFPDASGFTDRVSVTARDPSGRASPPATVNVTVLAVNDPPLITSYSPPGNVTLLENDVLDFTVTAADPESGAGVTCSWTVDDGPAVTGVSKINFRTNYSSAGGHTIKVAVSDGELSATMSWSVLVKNVNRGPSKASVIAPRPGENVKEGVSIRFEGSAEDPDGDELTFRWIDGLAELGIGQNFTSVLSLGIHKIILEVSDGTASVRSSTVSVTVKVNARPSIVSLRPAQGSRFQTGTGIPFSADVLDADGDQLSFTWTDNGQVIGTNQSFTLSTLPAGKHRVQLTVSDGIAVAQSAADFEVTGPAAAGVGSLPVLALAGVVAAVAVAAVAVLVLKKKGKKPPEAPRSLEQPRLEW